MLFDREFFSLTFCAELTIANLLIKKSSTQNIFPCISLAFHFAPSFVKRIKSCLSFISFLRIFGKIFCLKICIKVWSCKWRWLGFLNISNFLNLCCYWCSPTEMIFWTWEKNWWVILTRESDFPVSLIFFSPEIRGDLGASSQSRETAFFHD